MKVNGQSSMVNGSLLAVLPPISLKLKAPWKLSKNREVGEL
jgi:hypothetical protein